MYCTVTLSCTVFLHCIVLHLFLLIAFIYHCSPLSSRLTDLACDSTCVTSFFKSAFLNIYHSGVLTALTWLVPHETAAVSARSVYTIQPYTMSLLHSIPLGCYIVLYCYFVLYCIATRYCIVPFHSNGLLHCTVLHCYIPFRWTVTLYCIALLHCIEPRCISCSDLYI